MGDQTAIEWADATWNPITGCSVVSTGCTNCYAMKLAGGRLAHAASREGLTRPSKAGPVWTGEVRLNEPDLDRPLRWKRPRRIFVCAHGDLFHESVPDAWIDRVFAVMALAPQHLFMVLTKRADRMRRYVSRGIGNVAGSDFVFAASGRQLNRSRVKYPAWPLPNVWLGVSIEDQARARERIPDLVDTPAAGRFVSAEPLLGPVDISGALFIGGPCPDRRIDLVIVGGESGPGARPMHPDWARSLRDQCDDSETAFHFKQWGAWLDADQATAEGHAPGPDMFDSMGRAQGDRWSFYDPADPVGGAMIRVGKTAAGRLLDGRTHDDLAPLPGPAA